MALHRLRALVKRLLHGPAHTPLRPEDLQGRSAQEVFALIHAHNHWGSAESVSGSGSERAQTAALVQALPPLLQQFNVRSLLDVPCGDLNWMQHVDLSGVRYIGGDIVPAVVEADRQRFAHRPELSFQHLDLLQDPLPAVDLVLVRDCLVHFSLADVHRALANIRRSGARYLLTTTFTRVAENRDIVTGDWRPLNLQAAPFLLPPPVALIDEQCTEGNGRYSDKAMGLWEVAAL
jgi:SAM-dependent methyltransferase